MHANFMDKVFKTECYHFRFIIFIKFGSNFCSPVSRLKNQLGELSSTSLARGDIILRLLKLMFIAPIITLVRRMVCTWLQAPQVTVILNNWAKLEIKFAQEFRNNVQFKAGKHVRKFRKIWWVLVGFVGVVLLRQLVESFGKGHTSNQSWADAVGHWAFNIVRLINSYVLEIVEDFMILCLFQSVTTALRMVSEICHYLPLLNNDLHAGTFMAFRLPTG